VVGGRRNRRQIQAVRAQHGAWKAQRKARKSDAHKGAALAFVAEMKNPRVERKTAAALRTGLFALKKLSPNSEFKPASVKGAVRAEKAGESRRW
jgi:hypothetical protein